MASVVPQKKTPVGGCFSSKAPCCLMSVFILTPASGGLAYIVDKTFGWKSRCLRVCFVEVCCSHVALEMEIWDNEGLLGFVRYEPMSLKQFTAAWIEVCCVCWLIIVYLQHEMSPSLDGRKSNGLSMLYKRHIEYIWWYSFYSISYHPFIYTK